MTKNPEHWQLQRQVRVVEQQELSFTASRKVKSYNHFGRKCGSIGLPWWLRWKRIHLQCRRPIYVQSLGWEDPLEKEMATHSSILAWEIPWIEEPGGLQSTRVTRELGTTEWLSTAAAAKSLQSCLTLCDPTDGSPPGSPVPGILQARTLQWVAVSFSNAWKWKVKVKSLSCVQLLATPWIAAYQAPPSMGFSSQEYWSRLSLTSPGD